MRAEPLDNEVFLARNRMEWYGISGTSAAAGGVRLGLCGLKSAAGE